MQKRKEGFKSEMKDGGKLIIISITVSGINDRIKDKYTDRRSDRHGAMHGIYSALAQRHAVENGRAVCCVCPAK